MADVVLILGAGCSQKCGAPLMKDFVKTARNLRRTERVQDKAADFDLVFNVIDQLQQVHSKSQLDIENIETLFSAIDMAKTIGRLPGYDAPGQVDEVLTALRWVIVRTLEESMVFDLEDNDVIRGPGEYETLVETITYLFRVHRPALSVAIITFNYDVALELALLRGGINIAYGFNSGPPDSKTVRVLKLHGSLNWGFFGQAIHVWAVRDFASNNGIREYPASARPVLKVGSNLQSWFGRKGVQVEATPYLVPPTWNKGVAGNDLAQVWRSAAAELANAEYLYVIGYSIPNSDQFFPYLYALGTVGGKPFRDVAVLDPDPQVAERFRKLLGPGAAKNFKHFPNYFDGAAGSLRQIIDTA